MAAVARLVFESGTSHALLFGPPLNAQGAGAVTNDTIPDGNTNEHVNQTPTLFVIHCLLHLFCLRALARSSPFRCHHHRTPPRPLFRNHGHATPYDALPLWSVDISHQPCGELPSTLPATSGLSPAASRTLSVANTTEGGVAFTLHWIGVPLPPPSCWKRGRTRTPCQFWTLSSPSLWAERWRVSLPAVGMPV